MRTTYRSGLEGEYTIIYSVFFLIAGIYDVVEGHFARGGHGNGFWGKRSAIKFACAFQCPFHAHAGVGKQLIGALHVTDVAVHGRIDVATMRHYRGLVDKAIVNGYISYVGIQACIETDFESVELFFRDSRGSHLAAFGHTE